MTTLVTVHPTLEVTVIKNQIPLSLQLSVKKEKICSLLKQISSLKVCSRVTAEKLQAFAPLLAAQSSYYRHVVCTYQNGQMVHTSTVRSGFCLGQTDDKVCRECQKVQRLLLRKHQKLTLTRDWSIHIFQKSTTEDSQGATCHCTPTQQELSSAVEERKGHHLEETDHRMCASHKKFPVPGYGINK